jgi:hypothetical protein
MSSAIPTLASGVSSRLFALDFAFDAPFNGVTIFDRATRRWGREALEERHAGSRNILTAEL